MLELLLLAGALAQPDAAAPELVERRLGVMGTVLDLAVVAGSRERGLAASEEAVEEVRRVEDLLTTWRDSPLLRVDRGNVGSPMRIDSELYGLLAEVLSWSPRTEGAFDPTVLPLIRAWDLRGPGRLPSAGELDAALRATGAGLFRLDAADNSISRLDALAGIDEGAWGKGYALDRAAERLTAAGAAGALVDLGGQVIALGRDGRREAWTIALADPRRRDRPVALLRLEDASASTSGNSERGRTVGGVRIGHLLDPRTGRPAEDFGSVTVVAPSAFHADILSTAFFVLGPAHGLALSQRLRDEGVTHEVLFLVERGDRLDAIASPGLAGLVLWADASVVSGLHPFTP